MKHARIIVIAVLILLVGTLVALPQRGNGWQSRGPGAGLGFGDFFQGPRGGGMFIPPNHVLENVLGLDADQLAQVDAIRESVREQIEPLVESLHATGEALHTELAIEAPNPTTVGELVISMRDTRNAVQAVRDEGRAAFEAVLTEEQLALFQEHQERARRRGPRARGN